MIESMFTHTQDQLKQLARDVLVLVAVSVSALGGCGLEVVLFGLEVTGEDAIRRGRREGWVVSFVRRLRSNSPRPDRTSGGYVQKRRCYPYDDGHSCESC